MQLSDVVILSCARTAIGSFAGALSSLSPAQLGTVAAKAAISRSGVAADQIDHAVFGHIITTGTEDAYLARHIALNSGMPVSSAAFNVNRLCGSALQAVISAAQLIQLGQSQIALAGGAESMSNGAYLLPAVRKGLRLGHGAVTDLTLGILSDPFGTGHMGLTAETIAAQYGFGRTELDAFACESQRRAAYAQQQGYFDEQIAPVMVQCRQNELWVKQDEHIRPDTTVETLSRLKAAFKKDGLVTAGNASGLNDGAAALVLASSSEANRLGVKAAARLLGYSFAGVEPALMGLGPIPAVQKLLSQTGLLLQQIDVIESNEAFASQAMAVSQTLGFDPAKVNPNGGAIALGHPVGATGAILVVKALAELQRTAGRYGLITMCIGGGQGIALLIERL
ncbi:MAG: beta-ketothiolase BktB [Gammaproteobacteria bacterium]|nr:beta-ketothiolase BktB [Gammaproteobacteria bacterium]MBU2057760.1 beta-ketothiolase BktB [Gammaproteobacteria bacterium]MBU2174700.1 beta-ketothiolase BktB [Gammaproteobacteria bacterium]MBU2248957.1 beta-ketothiolase BktB [Gammaproteobacteria bacterium]MBU2345191.1 beta-ketothiolase BktB [Gammaproteobacteria bacterium]